MYKTKNVRNYDSGKVAKFQDAKLSGFGEILKKNTGGHSGLKGGNSDSLV